MSFAKFSLIETRREQKRPEHIAYKIMFSFEEVYSMS